MTKRSLEQLKSSLNPSTNNLYETLTESLAQAYSLTQLVVLGKLSLNEYESCTIQGYISALDDLILRAKVSFEALWDQVEKPKQEDK